MKKSKFLLAIFFLLVLFNSADSAEKITSTTMQRGGFLSSNDALNTAVIVKGADAKTIFNKGDAVFVLFRDVTAKVGDRFNVFKVIDEIKHPVTDKKAGVLIDILGSIEIIEIRKDAAVGRIDRTYKEINVGDRLKLFEPPIKEVEIKKAGKIVYGVVLTGLEKRVDSAKGDIIYIDKGRKNGIEAGNVLSVFRPRKDASHPVTDKDVPLPEKEIGRVVIINAQDDTSSALITQSVESIVAGDWVMTAE